MEYKTESKVEDYFIKQTPFKDIYTPTEKIKSIIVDNFPLLGKLTALRFLEWTQKNPGGVVSLPTGKTPEYFIKWSKYFLDHWKEKEVQEELSGYGLDPKIKPDIKSLKFVQIDEFYPISPEQHNSFHYYVNQFYIQDMGFDPDKALLIDTSKIGIPEDWDVEEIFPQFKVDLSLRYRLAKSELEKMQKEIIGAVDEYCGEYENKIREMGGIGFFLGGIGPDGHIAFNISGSNTFSTTRLSPVNYETAAAAAGDLGGIEISRNRLVITIGLETIAHRKDSVALIIAAGEAKAGIVADSIEKKMSIKHPASILHKLPSARFYLTYGACSGMKERNLALLQEKKQLDKTDIKTHLVNAALEQNCTLDELKTRDLKDNLFVSTVLEKTKKSISECIELTKSELLENIDEGLKPVKDQIILHTNPHHDDEMLGYLPRIINMVKEPSNKHFFTYLTSGFTSVTNGHMLNLFRNLKDFLKHKHFQDLLAKGYFEPGNKEARNDDIYTFLDGVASDSEDLKNEANARRLLRIVVEVLKENSLKPLLQKLDENIHYFETQYPGKKDVKHIQIIKGMVREWEAELVWGHFGFETSSVSHLRLGFYKGDIFSEQPTLEQDVLPVVNLLKELNPSVVTVALDPEGSGPDTHYKVLQAVSEALRIYEKETGRSDIKVWGYRNVWFKFHPADSNLFYPTSLNSIAVMNETFLNCFGSQKNASFPSYAYDGPFSKLSQMIMVEQYRKLKTLLGENYFYQNDHPKIRATRAFVFLKEMTLEEFHVHSLELRKLLENVSPK